MLEGEPAESMPSFIPFRDQAVVVLFGAGRVDVVEAVIRLVVSAVDGADLLTGEATPKPADDGLVAE